MVICIDESLDQMNLTSLAVLCTAELKRYRRRESMDDHCCLELLRRAILGQTDQAWAVLQECFSDTVRCWIRSHSCGDVALLRDSEENYVAQTMARFWCAMHEQPIVFASLSAVQSYLHATLNGILIDTLRTYQRSRAIPLPESGFPGEPTVEDACDGESIWQSIEFLLSDIRERRVAYLLYYCGLKPREIIMYCSRRIY